MLYLVYGSQNVMIKNRTKKIIKERLTEVDDLNLVEFDAEKVKLDDIIYEANTLPLGYDRKVIVLEHCFFLKKTYIFPKDVKEDFKGNLERFIAYIHKPNVLTDLILTLEDENIDVKNSIYNDISKTGKIYQLLSIGKTDWENYINRYFRESLKIEIDKDACKELAVRVKNDLNIFVNEAQKLALYTNHVTYKDVCLLVDKPLEDNTFDIFNFLIAKRNSDAIKIYKDLLVSGVEPVQLLSMLANQFRLLYQVIYLNKKGYTTEEIAKELNIKEIRVKIMKRNVYSFSLNKMHQILDDLYQLDYNIKNGLVDRFYGFEMFLGTFKY